MSNLAEKIFGTHSDREIKMIMPMVNKVLSYRDEYSKLSDEQLKNKTIEFKNRLSNNESLDSILPEAFATVREAAKRVVGMEHYPVQIIGGIILYHGRIAEMKTGEGKTLVSTCPAYLNALTGKGVHIVTVNEYLANRDCEWMGAIHRFLGLSCNVVLHDMDSEKRKEAYESDITYVTNNELGFDYLRDNMAIYKKDQVLRGLNYCIIDEVDSVLIDEARTPLIISGAANDATELYTKIDEVIPLLQRQDKEDSETYKGDGHFTVDEKFKQVYLTERGQVYVEELLRKSGVLGEGEHLFDYKNMIVLHHVNACLRAHTLFKKDIDYIVKNGEILIVDEHTGRTMEGRRWSDGLHQAIEAK